MGLPGHGNSERRVSALTHGQKWKFATLCATAGALAVPLHVAATPLSAAVAGLLGLLGLRTWHWSGLRQLVEGKDRRGLWRVAQPAVWIGLGLMVGLLMLAVIRIVIEPVLPSIGARIAAAGTLPVWRRTMIIYVAAVGEELLFRLLLLSAIAGVMVRLRRPPVQSPSATIVWVANGLSALVFAAAHLPSWSGASPMSAWLAVAVLAFNALGSMVLGYVFSTRGIAAAIWTHAGADCAIQLLGPFTG